MLESVELFGDALIASVVMSSLLSVAGVHIVSRERSVQSLGMAQCAVVGVLLGMIWNHHESVSISDHLPILPFVSAALLSMVVALLSEAALRHRSVSRSCFYLCVFVLATTITSLLGALLPRLQAHVTQAYFGDIATLGRSEARIALVFGIFGLLVLAIYRRRLVQDTFGIAVFGHTSNRNLRSVRLFDFGSMILIAISVQLLGNLFTLTYLFIPTLMCHFSSVGGVRFHTQFCVLLSILSALAGFLISLHWSTLPTAPSMSITLVLLGSLSLLCLRSLSVRERMHPFRYHTWKGSELPPE